ncbi:MAG TPA: YfhO family protein [Bacteroidales bacterium]|nr:YfhO family protein [Bacteroidales bacterium]HPT01068.1 YfhO family protein [Bacteroidales bacterium]
MAQSNFLKKSYPYFLAILIFVALTLVYFSPLLEGKRMRQSDTMNYQGMSKEISDYRAKTGEEALWTNSMFGGMPAYQISVVYKDNLVKYVDKIMKLGLPHPADLVFLYMIGFFILLLVLGVDVWLAVAGAVAFGFSSYFFIILEAGHNSKAHAIGYMAPVLAGIILTTRGKYLLGGILSALFISLELYANHLQITYYLLMVVGIFMISELIFSIREKRLPGFLKSIGVLIFASVIAVGCNITNLWSTYEYGKYTTRGKTELTTEAENRTTGLDKDYATDWSYGKAETFTLLVPNFMGGASQGKLSEKSESYKAMISNGVPENQADQVIKNMPLYWGPQPGVAGPVYIGAIVIFLFVLGLFIVDNKYRWWLLGAALLSVLLAWGRNFMPLTDFFLDYVPGYNKFRAVSMTLVIAEFVIPLLGVLALAKIFDGTIDKKQLNKKLLYALSITGGLTLIFALFGGSLFNFSAKTDEQLKSVFPDWLMAAVQHDRASMLRSDALRSLLFIVLAASAIWACINGKLKKKYVFPALIALVVIDLWSVDRRYVNNDLFVRKSIAANPFQPTQADELIMKDVDPYFRVFNQTVSPFNDASTSYFHKSIGGYHGAKLRRYQEIIDHHLSKGNMNVFNMLNTKYFIMPDQNHQPMPQINFEALGNAWFVRDVKMVKNADEEINALNTFRPKETAVVDKRFESFVKEHTFTFDSTATISLKSYSPNQLVYESSSPKEQLAVFSDIYYDKGWNAYIDGKEAPYFRANYILRAMMVPAGKHTIEYKFHPGVYYTGEKISLASSSLLILAMIAMFGWMIYKGRKNRHPETEINGPGITGNSKPGKSN